VVQPLFPFSWFIFDAPQEHICEDGYSYYVPHGSSFVVSVDQCGRGVNHQPPRPLKQDLVVIRPLSYLNALKSKALANVVLYPPPRLITVVIVGMVDTA